MKVRYRRSGDLWDSGRCVVVDKWIRKTCARCTEARDVREESNRERDVACDNRESPGHKGL